MINADFHCHLKQEHCKFLHVLTTSTCSQSWRTIWLPIAVFAKRFFTLFFDLTLVLKTFRWFDERKTITRKLTHKTATLESLIIVRPIFVQKLYHRKQLMSTVYINSWNHTIFANLPKNIRRCNQDPYNYLRRRALQQLLTA